MIVIVLVGFEFGGSERAVGDAVMVKFGSAITVRVNVALEVVVPLVPVMVAVTGPTKAVFVAVNVSVLPADPLTVAGLKAAVTPDGRPLRLNVIGLLNPLIDETVTLLVALVPCSTDAPDAVTENPGAVLGGIGGNAFCTSISNSVVQKVPADGEFGIAPVGMLLARALSCAGSQFGSPVVDVTPLYMLPG